MIRKENNFAYIFIGLIPKYKDLYTYLQEAEFTLVFKEVIYDGDYASLVKVLMERGKLKTILSPHTKDLCSILLKRTNASISYLNDQKSIAMLTESGNSLIFLIKFLL